MSTEVLDGNHWRTVELVNQLQVNAQLQGMYDLIAALKPELITSDDKYVFDYKGLLRGFGSTVHEAMVDFEKQFYSKKI